MDFSRRRFIRNTAISGTFSLSPFQRSLLWASAESAPSPCFLHTGSEYSPYIDRFVDHLQPGRDGFITEEYAAELDGVLETWRTSLCSVTRDFHAVESLLPPVLDASHLGEATIIKLRTTQPLESEKILYPHPKALSKSAFIEMLRAYLAPFRQIQGGEFQISGIEVVTTVPLLLNTEIRYDLTGDLGSDRREQRTGVWNLIWQKNSNGEWLILNWSADAEFRSRLTGPGFVDITASCLAGNTSYREQLLRGVDYWRTILDGACGIDIYGNNGIAVGDFDGDGFDDLYVCQPGGLPNRLYRNLGNGTFEDVTEKAGLAILDATSSAIFADLNNNGHQDLILGRASGPLLYINRGDGTFELRPDAFHFSNAPKGTFTGIAVGDYDRDGLLDIYFCLYNFYEGLNEYQYPSPYYDAQNGPPNFLLKNRGDYTFQDVTEESGMNRSNNRFSFACSWNDFDNDGWPDLYVVNDFGRKVLYKNNRDGTFSDVSSEGGIQDPGEGMSMTWLDYDNDGYDDLYIVNMWEPAGMRVMTQDQFLPSAPEEIRRIYRKDAMGNAMFHNEAGGGAFRDVTDESHTRLGGWNWGSDAWDIDHDGYSDLYVTNGFISGPKKDNLSSFFWRQVVARSFEGGGKSQGYEEAWNAVNEFIRSDHSWSGYQRNNVFVNNRNGSFIESSAILGLDFVDDSRAFALADLNHDGRLEVILKNRTAPQIRILQNRLSPLGSSIGFSLIGTKSNRDAIGAVIDLETPSLRQRRSVSAGAGFLMQHSKEVCFALGEKPTFVRALIRWPSGFTQTFENLPPGHRIEIVEGSSSVKVFPFHQLTESQSSMHTQEREILPDAFETWLIAPIPAPAFTLQDQRGRMQSLKNYQGRGLVVIFWQPNCDEPQRWLQALQAAWPEWQRSQLQLLIVQCDAPQSAFGRQRSTIIPNLSFPVLTADDNTLATYNIFYRYLFDRRRNMALPTAFLVDPQGAVIKVYSGDTNYGDILSDWQSAPVDADARLRKAFPFPGQYLGKSMEHNYFAFGVAFLRHGNPNQALLFFQESIDRNPSYAAAYYNIGLIYLNQHMIAQARKNLERAVELDPDNANAWNNLGAAYGQSLDYTRALSAFQRAITLEPANSLAFQNISKIYKAQGRASELQELLRSALKTNPNHAELHLELALLLADRNDMPGAKNEFEMAVQLQPQNIEALNGLGVVLLRMGKYPDAIPLFEQCLKLAPEYDRAYLNLALIYVKSGDIRQAHNILRQYPLTTRDSPDIRKALKETEGGK